MIHSGYDKTRSHRRPLACTLEMQVFQLQRKRELDRRCVSWLARLAVFYLPTSFSLFSATNASELRMGEGGTQLTSNLHDMQLVAYFEWPHIQKQQEKHAPAVAISRRGRPKLIQTPLNLFSTFDYNSNGANSGGCSNHISCSRQVN